MANLHEKSAEFGVDVDDSVSSTEAQSELSPKQQRRVIRKIDVRLVIMLGAMYMISLLDRTNMGQANVSGMNKELNLTGYRYNIISLTLFFPYIAFQPLAAFLIRKIGPRVFLSTSTLLWGSVVIGMGFVTTWNTMAGIRAILGALEAGSFSGYVYLLSTWYERYEVGKRYALFFILGSVAQGLSGILSYGLIQMDGLGGVSGWRWILIMEGIITCVIAFLGFIFLISFPDEVPDNSKFLTPTERDWLIKKVKDDRGDVHIEPFSLKKFFAAGLDIKIWCYGLIYFGTTTILYSIALFGPLILRNTLNFSVAASNLLIAPPFAFGAIINYVNGWYGDKYKQRAGPIIFNMVLCIIGLSMLGWTKNPWVRYAGMFPLTAGATSNGSASITYQANNIRGQWKRSFCSATIIGMGGIGGIAGAVVFRSQDVPHYHPGLWACMACALMNIVIVCGLTIRLRFENRRADREGTAIEGENDGFRYTI
ncbi:MFS general substrate transporter [Eremomyces bilateralis CBS 781.70]|uniref:MFS general substrate transporter n=1 Tax=Eremomyces bilateralis CBS 781.70 TaxID=1392243 RepID=A0A6G1GEZ2_9PEZI|nr:MFS general substrate transporter [Eremomyces bilateralis CBS 781.70]KAF1816647.1 MFS general substrate transporter [Eremomyces bilateralis CBS 781.70]